MSPMKPDSINVAGQPHHRTLLKVLSRKEDGSPDKIEVVSEETAVKDNAPGDYLVAYLPKKATEGNA